MDITAYSLLQKVSSSVISFLLQQIVYSSVLFVVIAILAWVLRKRSPYWQFCLWGLVFIRLVLPTTLESSWSARNLASHILLPKPMATKEIVIPSTGATSMSGETVSIHPDAALPYRPATFEKQSAVGPQGLSWHVVLFVLWAAGVSGLALLYIRKLVHFHRIIHRAAEVDNPVLRRSLIRWKNRFNVKPPVRLVSSEAFLSPFTMGIFRPTIFLPEQLYKSDDLSVAQMCIAHEMAHIRQKDDLWIKIQQLILLLFFFHPVAWYANRQILQARERICDQLVLKMGASSIGYGRSILKVLENNLFGRMGIAALPGFGGQEKYFSQRLLDIRAGNAHRKTTRWFVVCNVIVLALILLPMASSSQYDEAEQQTAINESPATAVPADIKAFLEELTSAILAHDMDRLADLYSKSYMLHGLNKKNRLIRLARHIPHTRNYEIAFTKCKIEGNIAHVSGYFEVNYRTNIIDGVMLIKENGKWRWYGNQVNLLQLNIDVHDFIEYYSAAMLRGDREAIAGFYSDDYLLNGLNKEQELERLAHQLDRLTYFKTYFTKYEQSGDKAVVEGFFKNQVGVFFFDSMIIKEDDQWKWYGNQKNTVPLPDDIQSFVDEFEKAVLDHDLPKLSSLYSDRFRYNGRTKPVAMNWLRSRIPGTTFFKLAVTQFKQKGNLALFSGAGEHQYGQQAIAESMLILENDQWKLYGNQK